MLDIHQTRNGITRISREEAIDLYTQATKAVKYINTGSVAFVTDTKFVNTVINHNEPGSVYVTTQDIKSIREDYFTCKDLAYSRVTLPIE